jgi:hypothetical protein
MRTIAALITGALCSVAGPAWADGYCDHVENVAKAEAALLVTPEVFGSVGYVEEPQTGGVESSDGIRVIAGLRYSLGDFVEASATKKRAKADCRRHKALAAVEGVTAYKALAARAAVLDDAMAEADQLLEDANDDLRQRRATAQEVDATRLRVDALRELAADTRAELDALPQPADGESIEGALGAYYRADAEVERQEAKLRSASAWDVNVRVGYDQFVDVADDSPFFAVVSLSVDLGWLVQGKYNKKAADGRKRAVREEHGAAHTDLTASRLQSLLEIEEKREAETAILLEDLAKQLKTLKKLGGDEGKRYREVVWFEWVKAKAEHAYYEAHVATLREVLGEEAK